MGYIYLYQLNPLQNTKYLDFINDPVNKNKYAYLSPDEKELIYNYNLLSDNDKFEICALIDIKLSRQQ